MGPLERLPRPKQLEGIYDPPNAISLDKVITRFDHHTTAFIEAATFLAAHVRDEWGDPIPVIAGGPKGFARVVDPTTVDIEIAQDSWPEDRLCLSPAQRYSVGLLLLIPGVKETVRIKGAATVRRASDQPAAGLRMRLQIDNSFFHCAKAFIRSRLWDPPELPTRWKGLRTFRCVRKEPESAVITSFYFEPADGGPAPHFRPGQHIPVQIAPPGHDEPLRRAYSLSSRPGEDTIRITVKREPSCGLASNHLHDGVDVGSLVQMRSPAGRFVLDESSTRPVVLLSAGVGLTPMVSMVEHLVASGSDRQIWYFHGARSGREHAMGGHVRRIAQDHANVHVHVCYADPRREDRPGVDYETQGRLTLDVLKSRLPWDDYEFYLCGPAPFMAAMTDGLARTGVPPERIRREEFSSGKPGPARLVESKAGNPFPATMSSAVRSGTQAMVEFRRSGKTVAWDSDRASLLDLAESHGVPARSSCRTGECFTCSVRLISGAVRYAHELDDAPDDGTVLICSATPQGDLVLDL